MNSSTLVATVSINYEDFAQGFLTCSTCFHAYDQDEHPPKLLSCSHTICRSCLERIASTPSLNNCQPGHITCPMCRQTIAIPDGGVGALPPSFLINQLFDLLNKKPREFIPKCSVHDTQELLFCETCDSVFCDYCENESGPNKHINDINRDTQNTSSTQNIINNNQQQRTNADVNLNLTSDTTDDNAKKNITDASQLSSFNTRSQTSATNIHETDGNKTNGSIAEHTVIPFSIAIKRMSEILHYRGQQCISKLNEAADNVQKEISKLDANSATALEDIDKAFNQIKSIIDKRKKELVSEAKKVKENKRNVLMEQMKIIENEKSKVNLDGVKIKNQMDVKNLSKKISELTERNDAAQTLYAPRENCFICFEEQQKEIIDCISKSVKSFGSVRTSKTYPPYCTASIVKCATFLKSVAQVQSIDYNGCKQKFGGDPISAQLRHCESKSVIDTIEIVDNRDGTYEVFFVPPEPGKYQLSIFIFNRPIKTSPIEFETCAHHNPVSIFGQRGKDINQFDQPVSLAINRNNGRLYILDSFNSRLKLLAQSDNNQDPFNFMVHIKPQCLGRSCTSVALLYKQSDVSTKDDHQDGHKDLAELKLMSQESIHDIYTESQVVLPCVVTGQQNAMPINMHGSPRFPNPNILVTNWRDHVVYELEPHGIIAKKYETEDMVEPTIVTVDNNNNVIVVDRNLIFIFDSTNGKLKTKLTGYTYADKTITSTDESSATKTTLRSELTKKSTRNTLPVPPRPIICTNNIIIASNQPNNAKIDISNNKSSTLKPTSGKKSSLNSKASSSLQRGSKAMFSAASKLKSTFTLPHSSSLVNAVSLQSMFKNQHHESPANDNKKPNSKNSNIKSNIVLVTNNGYQIDYLEEKTVKPDLTSESFDTKDLLGLEKVCPAPFGVIGAIAIGPDNELIVADESKLRILSPSSQYFVIREIDIDASSEKTKNSKGTFSGLVYDSDRDLLLCLRNEKAKSFIQIVDYRLGTLKFTIDSNDSRLMRPSSIAIYSNYVYVTDLGNDCIKKYRYY